MVRAIIARRTGVASAHIEMDTDLCADLGVSGDDGVDLFAALDEAFDVDWRSLQLAVHFGNEGWGLPFPWQLEQDSSMYQRQPCKVADIVKAVETGRWHGTKLVHHPRGRRLVLYALSSFQIAFISFIFVAGVWAASGRLPD